MMISFLVCHMIGVSSSCTNPILYGFLNDNFIKEHLSKSKVGKSKLVLQWKQIVPLSLILLIEMKTKPL